ncbi:MAG: hypothetical protein E7295_03525 [Lachnospiraceae bacterium]|jgi:hypothetical protein|nr:hypothetical protein [Lachnospiraceae bacterium]
MGDGIKSNEVVEKNDGIQDKTTILQIILDIDVFSKQVRENEQRKRRKFTVSLDYRNERGKKDKEK